MFGGVQADNDNVVWTYESNDIHVVLSKRVHTCRRPDPMHAAA